MRFVLLIICLSFLASSVAEAREPTRAEARIERMMRREAVRSSLAPLMRPPSGRERERLNRDIIRRYRRELNRENRRSKK